jgi:hypothetical protein
MNTFVPRHAAFRATSRDEGISGEPKWVARAQPCTVAIRTADAWRFNA